jgi:hypothetical protein
VTAIHLHGESLQLVHGVPLDALQLHESVHRHEDAHVVAAPVQMAGQRGRNVTEAAGFRERRDFGSEKADSLTHHAC